MQNSVDRVTKLNGLTPKEKVPPQKVTPAGSCAPVQALELLKDCLAGGVLEEAASRPLTAEETKEAKRVHGLLLDAASIPPKRPAVFVVQLLNGKTPN